MIWQNKTLGEIYASEGGNIQTGPFGSQLHESDYKDSGVPVIMPKDIINDKLDKSGIAFISTSDANRLKKHIVRINDIVFPRRGEINKRVIIQKEDEGAFCGTGCIRLRGTGKILDQRFLFYYLKQRSIVKWIENQAIGATMANLNTSIFKSVPIHFPPLPIQSKIASILSAYDDLIENNKQRIQLLEEMAEEIYKEWFVRLRFPGYQDSRFLDQEGREVAFGTPGALPEGWERMRIESFGRVVTGKTPSKSDHSNFGGKIPFIKTPDFQQGKFFVDTDETLTLKGANNQKSQFIPKNTICVSCIGTVGKVGITTQTSQTNQQINSIILDDEQYIEFLYYSLVRLKPIIESFAATGATMANLSKSKFENLPLICPRKKIVIQYSTITNSLFKETIVLMKKNKILQETRDLLLPRLISGKLSVEELDIKTDSTTPPQVSIP